MTMRFDGPSANVRRSGEALARHGDQAIAGSARDARGGIEDEHRPQRVEARSMPAEARKLGLPARAIRVRPRAPPSGRRRRTFACAASGSALAASSACSIGTKMLTLPADGLMVPTKATIRSHGKVVRQPRKPGLSRHQGGGASSSVRCVARAARRRRWRASCSDEPSRAASAIMPTCERRRGPARSGTPPSRTATKPSPKSRSARAAYRKVAGSGRRVGAPDPAGMPSAPCHGAWDLISHM